MVVEAAEGVSDSAPSVNRPQSCSSAMRGPRPVKAFVAYGQISLSLGLRDHECSQWLLRSPTVAVVVLKVVIPNIFRRQSRDDQAAVLALFGIYRGLQGATGDDVGSLD